MLSQDSKWLLKEKYGGEKSEAFFADLKRLEAGEPLAYVIGSTPFLNCTIYLDSQPLIPRPETEFWVERAIAEIKRVGPQAPRVLDLCAGSGAIGIAIAKAMPEAHVTFGEIEPFHLPTIDKNLSENDIASTRHQVVQSNLFENIRGQFDFILSNPPYIDPKLDRTEPSVKNFEPAEALYGGVGGMELIERIVTVAVQYLNSDGQLWLEHEPEQVEAVTELAKAHNFAVVTHKDQYDVSRYSVLAVAQ